MIEEMPSISQGMANSWFFDGRAVMREGIYHLNEKGATFLLGTIGFPLFLIGCFTGSAILKNLKTHRVLGLYAVVNVLLCGIVVLRFGWISVTSVFLIFLFMSIMFPTIFALGIYGLDIRAKRASGFIVMAIIGGGVMPKLMGRLGNIYNMSVSFLVPLACFALIALYGYSWSILSKVDSVMNLSPTRE